MIGVKIGGRYEIVREIGRGGMGAVYLAHDPLLQRDVAVKVLTAHLLREEIEERFRREARIIARLDHIGIVPVHDTGTHEKSLFFVMPYVEGNDLRTYLEHRLLRLNDFLEMAIQIADALEYSHSKEIVHRDIKPENILLSQESGKLRARLTDFGLALTASDTRLTMNGQVAGTISYLSPEQVSGGAIDFRTDLYSFGTVLFECISGNTPFTGSLQTVLYKIAHEKAPVLRSLGAPVDARLEELILQCLEKDPSLRPRSGSEIASELRKCMLALPAGMPDLHVGVGPANTEIRSFPPPAEETELIFFSPSRDQEKYRNNLPAQLTPFVGRESELGMIQDLLRKSDVRLVTLTGPGGTGKTQLAIQVAMNLLSQFPGDVFFVPLGNIHDPSLVASEITQVLGIQVTGGRTDVESLKEFLQKRKALLLIDNFEQVITAGPLLSRLLQSSPGLKILVTSREVLRIQGEHEYSVPPLPLPELQEPSSPESLVQYPSVALFVQRASKVHSGFTLTEENSRAIAEICVRLEGLPLAIELAAARTKLLAPQAMLARMGKRLQILTGGGRDLPSRQQTMRGAIEWGYNLLSDADKQAFRMVSVFVGGFTLEAAEAVCAAKCENVLELLASLVDKSLIRQETGEEPRFVMLETIREFGLEALVATGEQAELQVRHAGFFRDLAERAEPELSKSGQELWLDRLEKEHDNFRSALEWTIGHGDTDTAIRLAAALWWFWYLHGHYNEGRKWLEGALKNCSGCPPFFRARALLGSGVLAFLQCDYSRAEALLNDCVGLSRQIKENRTLASSLQFLGSIAREQGDYERAISLHQVTIPLWQDLQDQRGVARALNYIGFAAWLQGDFEQTQTSCEESLALYRLLGDKEGIAWALLNLGAAAHYQNRFIPAAKYCKESMVVSREVGFKEGLAWAWDILGNTARQEGQHPRAVSLLQRSLRLHWALGDKWRTSSVLEGLACAAYAQGKFSLALTMSAAASNLRQVIGTPIPPVEKNELERSLSDIRAALSPETFSLLWTEGIQMPLDEAIAKALSE